MEIAKKKTTDNIPDLVMEMGKAGLHFGRKRSFVHPKMRDFIGGLRGNIFLIDLFKTEEKLSEAIAFIKKSVAEGKKILFVGTKIPAREPIRDIAESCDCPFITERWIGGFFTNFDGVLERIKRLKELEDMKTKGGLEKYSKKERVEIEKELERLEKKFGGLKKMESIPDIIFVIDPNKERYCVAESKKKGLPVVAVGNLDTDPRDIDYLIPANDNVESSIRFILEKVKEAILKNKK